jgi:sRNA-binding regulator protein Hfq
MSENQRTITGHVEITGLGCNGKRLEGKTVTVFTLDGKEVTGEVLEASSLAVYIAESSTECARMIKSSAIVSISMSKEDADILRAKTPMSVVIPKAPVRVPSRIPRF